MITTSNYFTEIQKIGADSLPPVLKKAHDYVESTTKGGKSWEMYQSNDTIKRVIDLYIAKLNDSIGKQIPQPQKPRQSKQLQYRVVTKADKSEKILSEQEVIELANTVMHYERQDSGEAEIDNIKDAIKALHAHNDGYKVTPLKKAAPVPHKTREENAGEPKTNESAATIVERIDESVRFVKRYAALHGKVKTRDQLLAFLRSLQKAFVERRIRKADPLASEMESIQDNLIKAINAGSANIEVSISTKNLERYKQIAESEKINPSVSFIKRFIRLHGRTGIKEEAKHLLKHINHAIEKDSLTKDKYYSQVEQIKSSLENYLNSGKGTLEIQSASLQGLISITLGVLALAGAIADHYTIRKLEEKTAVAGLGSVVSSEELASQVYETIPLTGKWKDLIGIPYKGFKMLVYGPEKQGKSSLCLMFAHYLAENHGNVLYASYEEFGSPTLTEKVNRLKSAHSRLHISGRLPEDLSIFDFVFIDSITRAEIDLEKIRALKQRCPDKTFVFIAQSTKDGSFRGSREVAHEVDVVVKVFEDADGKKVAEGYGRFNQGSQTKVF